VAGVVALVLAIILFIQDSPLIYYAYAGFPVFFWEHVLSNRGTIWLGLQVLTQSNGNQISPVTVATQSILYISVLESLVPPSLLLCPISNWKVYGYFHRHIFSICFIFAAVWPFTYGPKFWKSNYVLVGSWVLSCVVMSSFTLLPVVKQESLPLMYFPALFHG
jgi:GPI ethanolamine phosphate transferase 1